MQVWLSPEILRWCARADGGLLLDKAGLSRSYQHLQRAEHFLKQSQEPSEYDRADCIGNLRKCFTHRLQLIEDTYQLRSALTTLKKSHYLELLAELGVVRPSLLQALLSTRNAIEYSDAAPPDVVRCQELVDAVWYFLRATDPLVSAQNDIHLFPADDDPFDSIYWLSYRINYTPKLSIKISGWLFPELVSHVEQRNFLEVCASDLHTKKQKWGDVPSMHGNKQDDDIWIIGNICPNREQTKLLLQQAFNAAF